MTALGVAAWSLVAIGIAAAAWGVLNSGARRRLIAAGVVLLVTLGLVLVMLAGMGAFCVPPPGAACM